MYSTLFPQNMVASTSVRSGHAPAMHFMGAAYNIFGSAFIDSMFGQILIKKYRARLDRCLKSLTEDLRPTLLNSIFA